MSASLESATYRQLLKNLSLTAALHYIAQCSIRIWWQMPPQPLYRHIDSVGGVARWSELYGLTDLAYLASEIVANARGTEQFELEHFDSGIKFIHSPSSIVEALDQVESKFRGIQLLLAAAYPQIASADGPRLVNRFGRHWLLYNEIGVQRDTGSISRFIARFPQMNQGLSIPKFMIAGSVAFALALANGGQIETSSFSNLRVGSTMIQPDTIDCFLQAVSATPETFKRKMLRAVSEKWHMHTLTNPLLTHPVIKMDSTYLAPLPQLLIDRCGVGIREDFRTGLSTEQFRMFSKDLGRAFEKYLRRLVENTNPHWCVWSERDYDGLKSCDLLILDEQALILVECKSSPMRRQVKTWMSKAAYDQELGKVAEGIEAIVRTAKHLREGKLRIEGLEVERIQQWAGFVVTMDEYLLRPSRVYVLDTDGRRMVDLDLFPVRDYFLQVCRARSAESQHVAWQDALDFPEAHLQVVSVDDFEQHLAATAQRRANLFDLTTGQVLPGVHPMLQDRFDRHLASVSAG